MRKAVVISVSNQKGGVGKTATARSLIDYYASKGKRVLAIDLDSQASLTKGFGIDPDLFMGNHASNICNIFRPGQEVKVVALNTGAREKIHLLPGNRELSSIGGEAIPGKELKLKKFFTEKDVRNVYDVVVIDNNPKFDAMTQNSTIVADVLVVPVVTAKDDADGLRSFLDMTEVVLDAFSETIERCVIVPTKYRANTNSSKIYLRFIQEGTESYIKEKLPILGKAEYQITDPVPDLAAFQESASYNLSPLYYLTTSPAKKNIGKSLREGTIFVLEGVAKISYEGA